MKNKLINKKVLKLFEGKCKICGCDSYASLDVHRINPGAKGGRYTKTNSVVLCANCHREVHDNKIQIDKYYLSTDGTLRLRILLGEEERFI